MEIEIEFNFLGQTTILQCDIGDNFNNIFKSFASKAQIDINSVFFFYSGIAIEKNKNIEQIINNVDKERKRMTILVSNKEDSYENIMTVKPNGDEIIINYDIKDKNEIEIFSEDFVKNNKDNCRIIIEGKEQELIAKYEIKNLKNKKDNILSIKLKVIKTITNMDFMFC